MTAAKPASRPKVPHFSSGPCAKRPGWNPQNLKDAALGRSHRAKIGKDKLAWWDIFAPLGKTDKVYSYDEARDFILENFGKFSPDLQAFALVVTAGMLIAAQPARVSAASIAGWPAASC